VSIEEGAGSAEEHPVSAKRCDDICKRVAVGYPFFMLAIVEKKLNKTSRLRATVARNEHLNTPELSGSVPTPRRVAEGIEHKTEPKTEPPVINYCGCAPSMCRGLAPYTPKVFKPFLDNCKL